ncbi:MAG: hypothetical protein QOI55_2115, partial [Actinomycetota bacterium]|nr:hypothetical protein [Actinomycetota bacterium]
SGEHNGVIDVDTSPPWLRVATTLVVLTVAYAALAHGAYYASELRVVLVLVVAALSAAAIAVPLRRADLDAPVLAAGCLALWYVVAGIVAHHPGGAIPAVELLAALAALVTIVRRADDREREFLLFGLLAVGAVVALAGWSGVAWHQTPRALADDGLWRAASTITYANVTGALTGALGLVACARVSYGVNTRVHALLAFVLLTGAFATASRGALLGVAAGLVVLAVLRRERIVVIVPGLLGALVATLPRPRVASAISRSLPSWAPASSRASRSRSRSAATTA